MPSCFDSSAAAVSAPVHAERNTGFVELFAIIVITNGLPAAAAPPWALSFEPLHAVRSEAVRSEAVRSEEVRREEVSGIDTNWILMRISGTPVRGSVRSV